MQWFIWDNLEQTAQTDSARPLKSDPEDSNSYSIFLVKAEVRNKNTVDGIDCEMFFCERVPSFQIFFNQK